MSPAFVADQEELQEDTSTDEVSDVEIDEAVPSADAETIHVFETSQHEELAIPDHTDSNSSAPDRPDISSAPSTENALCECCGTNGFLQDELLRIDSGQRRSA